MINIVESAKSTQIIQNSFTKMTTTQHNISYPACFNKKDLARAIENKTGTTFFYGSEYRLDYYKLRVYVFSHNDLIKKLDWINKSKWRTRNFIGPTARLIAEHLELSSEYFKSHTI